MAAEPSAAFAPLQPGAGALPASIVAGAANWLALLESGHATVAQKEQCAAWRAADARHELAWQRLVAIDKELHNGAHRALGPAPPARQALHAVAKAQARRRAGRWSLGLALAGAAAWTTRESTPWSSFAATHRTGTGERRTLTLPDGSSLILASATALDLDETTSDRSIQLRTGEIMVLTGPGDGRALSVTTRDGSVSPRGTRFTVARHGNWTGNGSTEVAVLAGAVDIRPASSCVAALRLPAGRQLRFTAVVADAPQALAAGAGAWSEGMLVADRMRLDAFIAELGRWHAGVLRCDDDASALRITGAFPLADTERVLATLARILPVQVERRTRWWTTVRARAARR